MRLGIIVRPTVRGFSIPNRVSVLCFAFLLQVISSLAAEVDISKLPPPAAREVDFSKEIRPLFENTCLKCHNPEQAKGKLLLDTREHALKGGEEGPVLIPGESGKSLIVHLTAGLVEDSEMPPKGKGEALTGE